MFRKQIHKIRIPLRLVLPIIVVAQLLRTPTLFAQTYEWKVIARPNLNPLLSVDFIDTLHGVCGVFGEPGALVTTDGGFSWDTARTVFAPRAMDLVDDVFGWAAGTSGKGFSDIGRTTDEGHSWTLLREKFGEEFHGVAGLSPTKCICAGFAASTVSSVLDTAMVLRTTDGGSTWERTLFDLGVHLSRIHFADTLTGWVESDSYPETFVLRTTDAGSTWQKCMTPILFEAMFFLDTFVGWGGQSGYFYQTRDGGNSWVLRYQLPVLGDDFNMSVLSFTDTLNGWAFGNAFYLGTISEAIYRTTDAGNTWYRESIGLTSDFGELNDAVMLDITHGLTVANDGRVLAYQRGPDHVRDQSENGQMQPRLPQNYPNPFNGATTIEYRVVSRSHVRLEIFDVLGRQVTTLVDYDQSPGDYGVRFDARQLASGPYYYLLTNNSSTIVRKMLIVK